MKKKLVSMVIFLTCSARDPFFYPDGKHHYFCTGIGSINKRPVFASIGIDGRESIVRVGDIFFGHEVLSLTKNAVTIKDEKGVHHILGSSS